MHRSLLAITFAGITSLLTGIGAANAASDAQGPSVQLGPRPFFLVNDMTDSALRRDLQWCANHKPHFSRTDFSIGHRGAALQFPEHTQESYEAAALMGAGIVE